ncbi:MAG TPA: hypothetical protein VFV33_16680, partial [Gemmatimonadaceae bacterium]|nr:hypothetical protein [Gemmatimonadaceae bacterium]
DYTLHVPWTKSPGVQVVRVAVELHESVEIGDSQTVTVTLPSGAAWISDGGLDGGTHYNPPVGSTRPREIIGWCDVSAVTEALTTVFSVAIVTTAKGAGVYRVTVCEVPLATLAVDADEPGWDAAATRAGRPVIDGGASSPRGTQRLFHLLDLGRAHARQHLCLSGVESADTTGTGSTPHWSRESATLGEIDWVTGADAPCWYLQVRDLYAGATTSTWSFRARYRTSNATACEVRIYHQGGGISGGAWVGAGAEGSTTLNLTGTSGSWSWATATGVSLPVDGTDGLVRIRFEAKGPGAAQLLSIACLDLREDEP